MSRDGVTIAEIVGEYVSKRQVYKDFAESCSSLLQTLLRQGTGRVHSVSCREKSPDRLVEKLGKQDKGYSALSDVTDLAGVRIITYFSDDVDEIADIIEAEFDIEAEQSIDKRAALDPDRFGYLSLHYICRMPERRLRLREYAPYAGMVCEIQVRSILQHAWAEIEHDLGYKTRQAVPRPIRRRFSRLAALLETADDEFIGIRDSLATYTESVRQDIEDKPAQVLLDQITLRVLLEQDEVVRHLEQDLRDWMGASEVMDDSLFFGKYVGAFARLGVTTIEQLLSVVRSRYRIVLEQYKLRITKNSKSGIGLFASGMVFFHTWQVLLAERNDIDLFASESVEAGIDMGPDPKVTAAGIITTIRQVMDSQP
jgi:putative GTP pyrophosphokinase